MEHRNYTRRGFLRSAGFAAAAAVAGWATSMAGRAQRRPDRKPNFNIFRCAFTTAEGWGTFSQTTEGAGRRADVRVKWGKLRLKRLALQVPEDRTATQVRVSVAG